MFAGSPVSYCVIAPAVVIRPMRPGFASSVNQRLPLGPAVMFCGLLLAVSPVENSVIVPVGVIRPIFAGFAVSVNQTFPSAPAAIP